jgi:hypothetical protein
LAGIVRLTSRKLIRGLADYEVRRDWRNISKVEGEDDQMFSVIYLIPDEIAAGVTCKDILSGVVSYERIELNKSSWPHSSTHPSF